MRCERQGPLWAVRALQKPGSDGSRSGAGCSWRWAGAGALCPIFSLFLKQAQTHSACKWCLSQPAYLLASPYTRSRCSLISKPEMHLKLSFQDLEAFLIKLSACRCFQGHITLWNHGINIIAFEMKGGSCALHQKFLLVLINPVYKCHGLHPQGVYIEFLAASVSLAPRNKCHIIW